MVVFRWRKQLLSLDNSGPKSSSGGTAHRSFAMKDLPSPAPMSQSQSARYEVTITSQVPHSADWKNNMSSPRNTTYTDEATLKSPTSAHARFSSLPDTTYPPPTTNVVVQRPPIRVLDANKATLSYCKTALLFFVALLCTWYVFCCPLSTPSNFSTNILYQGSFYNQPSEHSRPSGRLSLRTRPGVQPGAPSARILEHIDLHRHQFPGVQSAMERDFLEIRRWRPAARPKPPVAEHKHQVQQPPGAGLGRHTSRHLNADGRPKPRREA